MKAMIELRVLSGDDWRLWRELRLQALEEAPGAFSSTLTDWRGDRDAEPRWRDRLANVPFNVIAELNGKAAGMVGATWPDSDSSVELISMWVAPFARGRGVGDALIDAVIAWARERRAARVVLTVMESNEFATKLYRRHRFADAGAVELPAGAPAERRMAHDL
jgi:ribosomal protein S18 acetylase RimI-like enzyme